MLMLLIATADLDYSYYQFLRIIICGISVFLAWYFIKLSFIWFGWVSMVIAVLFNPIFPIFLDKSTWIAIDLICAVLFLASTAIYKHEKDEI